MKRITMKDVCKTKAQKKFVKRIIRQAHANARIRKILNIENESIKDTIKRVLSE